MTVPIIGTMAPATESDDARYLDFLEGVRHFEGQRVRPSLKGRYEQAAQEFEQKNGRPPGTEEARDMMDGITLFQSRSRLWRSSQEQMWRGVIDTYRKREGELMAELDRADQSGPGSVSYDPNFHYPDYFDAYDAHIQPGSYHRDPLAGYIYHYGTKLFYQGFNDTDDVQRKQVFRAPLPVDGKVNRILDLGCSVGQSATAWKERCPGADVWGIDIAAPMVRYAHKRAVDMNLEIHFAQMTSEKLEFPNAHFDVVYAYILFHEIPMPVIRRTVREACRVLRPGGVFTVCDFGRDGYRAGTPFSDYTMSFVINGNGEPYARDFCEMDFTAELKQAGFQEAIELDEGVLQVGTK